MVGTIRESTLVPISVVGGVPQIIDLTHGIQPLLVGYYYVLRSDIHVGPEADFLVVEEEPRKSAYSG